MNIPIEIIACLLTVLCSGILAALGFIFQKLLRIENRIMRIESRLGIETEL